MNCSLVTTFFVYMKEEREKKTNEKWSEKVRKKRMTKYGKVRTDLVLEPSLLLHLSQKCVPHGHILGSKTRSCSEQDREQECQPFWTSQHHDEHLGELCLVGLRLSLHLLISRIIWYYWSLKTVNRAETSRLWRRSKLSSNKSVMLVITKWYFVTLICSIFLQLSFI